MTASNLVIPVVLWGKRPPTHCISSLWMSTDQKYIVTGCNDGQLCVWDVDAEWNIEPRKLLLGHTAAINCLTRGSSHADKNYLISASDSGEMSLWDLCDGRCIEHTKKPLIHTNIQAHQLLQQRDVSLICIGYYADIYVIHPQTLDIQFSLSSKLQPDWISAFCMIRPVNREDDVAVAVSNSGTVKVWTLSSAEPKGQQPVYEDEAKQTRCLNAQTLRCCPYNQRTVLVVCSKYWQIYDAGDFSLLCSESSRRNERWLGGDFIAIDKVVVWSSEGKAYLYKLPINADPRHPNFHKVADPCSPQQQGPQAYSMMDLKDDKALECIPAMIYVLGRREKESKLLLRGDSEGRLVMWSLPEINDNKMKLVRQESFHKLPVVFPKTTSSFQKTWDKLSPAPEGIVDHLAEASVSVSSSIYIPSQGRLVLGRDDGSIVIVSAVEALLLKLLHSPDALESLPHQILLGHSGRVNCLLYPHNEHTRYDSSHLLSGGADFSVVLWDLTAGCKLHTFCVHGGEVTQLLVPPFNCNTRVLSCVASVASDHSLSLLSLRERKSILLASRQLFPITKVKWRPLDDFLLIGCIDGTVFVWQMETGHLDRVVTGTTAEDILSACDERLEVTTDISNLTNPTISIAQAFKRGNLATFRNFAQQQLQKAQDVLQSQESEMRTMHHPSLMNQTSRNALLVQGLKTNNRDAEAHILFFDTEALIVQLLQEEYSQMSPSKLEALGFYINVPQSQANLSSTQKKVAGFLSKVKDKAENVGQQLQAKLENEGMSPKSQRKTNGHAGGRAPTRTSGNKAGQISIQEDVEPSHVAKVAQLFLSCLHAWGLDTDLDKLCMNKLGLLCPKVPFCFGMMSRGNHMSLLLPGWHNKYSPEKEAVVSATSGHWLVSSALTTQHLLSVISTANTLMGMTNTSLQRTKRLVRSADQSDSTEELPPAQQAQSKQGWSLLATLHCVLLPDLIGKDKYRPPQLDILARKWQDRCLEIRSAAQALLLGELRRIGAEGRKAVVDQWAPLLPSYVDPALTIIADHQQQQPTSKAAFDHLELDEEDQMLGNLPRSGQSFETRKRQATSIVMLGVLGAEFGAELEPSHLKTQRTQQRAAEKSAASNGEKKNVVEGFGLSQYSHSMHTSQALTFLLLQPATSKLPSHTAIRRAAVDLLGRGFTVWEPYLDVSAVIKGLLELCVDGDRLVPSMTFGLPLIPLADACRTARHALSLMATARPATFIITMAKEVARYNSMLQNSQSHHHSQQLHQSPLVRAKPEILRIVEILVDKIPNDVADLLLEVMDIVVHCVDHSIVKQKGLQEIFPPICKFSMVSYCAHSRRVAAGAKNGTLAFHEFKQTKSQVLHGHTGSVTAVAFSQDGKYLASYCFRDSRLTFWQTASTSLFSLGSQTIKSVKTYSTPPIRIQPTTNSLKIAKLVWVDSRTVVLLSADGTESRFRV